MDISFCLVSDRHKMISCSLDDEKVEIEITRTYSKKYLHLFTCRHCNVHKQLLLRGNEYPIWIVRPHWGVIDEGKKLSYVVVADPQNIQPFEQLCSNVESYYHSTADIEVYVCGRARDEIKGNIASLQTGIMPSRPID